MRVSNRTSEPTQLPMVRPKNRGIRLAWAVIAGSMILLVCVVASPFWLPNFIRTVVPGRYIVAYFPEPLKEIILEQGVDRSLPTLAPNPTQPPSTLLAELALTEGVNPTPLPTIGGQEGEITLTPDSNLIASTPTPAFASEGTLTVTAASDLPSSYYLSGFTHTYQEFNNCGPATLTTLLSYWGIQVTQHDVAAVVKPDADDNNVSPHDLQGYVESLGYEMLVRSDGDLELLKRFIGTGYPVIIEEGYDPPRANQGWMGHYLLLFGYSDIEQNFISMDSYDGPDHLYSYAHINEFWRHFNRTYLVVYPPEDTEIVASIVGEEMDDAVMYRNAIRTAQDELNQNPQDAFGWHNIGASLVALGDYESAEKAFDQARTIGLPWRMLWYQFGLYEAYFQVGRYEDVMTLADATLSGSPLYKSEEAYYYRGRVYATRGQAGPARDQFNLALASNPNFTPAREALAALGN